VFVGVERRRALRLGPGHPEFIGFAGGLRGHLFRAPLSPRRVTTS
jgi:hypothetical protein